MCVSIWIANFSLMHNIYYIPTPYYVEVPYLCVILFGEKRLSEKSNKPIVL